MGCYALLEGWFAILFMYIFLAHANIGAVFLNIGGGYSNKTSDF
jgi:hypothetical protein